MRVVMPRFSLKTQGQGRRKGCGIQTDGLKCWCPDGIDVCSLELSKESLWGCVLQDRALRVGPVCSLINLPGW